MSSILYSLTVLILGHAQIVQCEREHKVHNIVLYPEKHSWCQTTPIQQVVAAPGYDPVTIENNVCVGACFSYSIPKSEPAEPGELIGPYCDSCQPEEIKCYHVNLRADTNNIEGLEILQKRVQIIMNCSCQSCDKVRKEDCEINDTNTLELPRNLFVDPDNPNKTNSEDVIHPDLFDAQNSENTQHFENDIKLKNKLKKWFEDYQNDGGENDDRNRFTKNTELDNLDKNLNDIGRKNEKIQKDLEGLPKNFGLEGAPSHHKGSHVGMGMTHHPNDVVDSDSKISLDHSSGHHGHHGHHSTHRHSNEDIDQHKHHHHLGEEQHIGTNVAHLIRGPHGSMVVAPTDVKLHIDSDALKPNDEGLIVEYENHHHLKDSVHKIADLMEEE